MTVGWMVIEGAIALGAGIVAHSVALTAFGVDSGIELFSSVVVLRRLLQRSESEERGSMTGGERNATSLVGVALYGLVAYNVLETRLGRGVGCEPAASPRGAVARPAPVAGSWLTVKELVDDAATDHDQEKHHDQQSQDEVGHAQHNADSRRPAAAFPAAADLAQGDEAGDDCNDRNGRP